MKLTRSIISVSMAATLACVTNFAVAQTKPADTYGMVVFLKGSEFFNWAYAGFKDAATSVGARTELQGPPDWDASAEARAISELTARGVKGVAVTAGDANTMVSSINQAVAKGVPVVTFDSDSPKSKRLLYVGTAPFNAGYQAGLKVGAILGDKARVGISMVPGVDTIDKRIAGFQAGLKKAAPGGQVVAQVNDEGDLQKAETVDTAMLQAHPDINAIFCAHGNPATGAAAAARNVGKTSGPNKVHVIAFAIDVPILQMVERGEIDATVAQNPYLEGVTAFYMLWAAAHKTQFDNIASPGFGNVPSSDIDTGVKILSKGDSAIKTFMTSPKL